MKITLAPLVSDVRNRFGGQVFTNWKGIAIDRRFAYPSNPNTTAQKNVRFSFKNINRWYAIMPALQKAAWENYIKGKALIGRNVAIGKNIPILKAQDTLANIVMVPGDASAIPLYGMAVANGVGQLVCTCTPQDVPAGWAITSVIVAVVRDQNWRAAAVAHSNMGPKAEEDVTSPYVITITGLNAGWTYRVAGFVKYLADDNSIRYSEQVLETGNPT